MRRGLFGGGEHTSGLDNVVCASFTPGDLGGVLLGVEFYGLAVDDKVVTLDLDVTLELTVSRVILEHVGLGIE